MAEIRLQEGESLENALRRFKRKVQSEDIIKEVKRPSYYLKPGEKRRVNSALARKRARKKVCNIVYSEDLQDGQVIERSLTVRNPFRS